MSRTVRQLILFGAPLFVGVINIFHPVHFASTGLYDAVQDHVSWWITLHILNLLGFPLIALAAYLLISGEQGSAAKVARVALAVFVPTYAGFDSVIGIGSGNLIQYAKSLQLDQLPILKSAIDAFWSNGTAIALAIIGSVAWSIGMFAIAVNFAESRRRPALIVLSVSAGVFTGWGSSSSSFGSLPWWIGVLAIGLLAFLITRPSIIPSLLILSGVLFGTTHVVPFGPLGMLSLLGAVTLIEFERSKSRMPARMAAVSSQS
jgi:hypothetical protein